MNRERVGHIVIREFSPGDAQAVSDLIRHDLRAVNIKDYPPETIESMLQHFAPENLIKLSQQPRQMFVAEDCGKVVATGSLAENWILTFFVAPEYHGRGVGKQLLTFLEEQALAKGRTDTFVPSGFTALPFYKKRGYTEAADQSKATKDWIILSKQLAGMP
jgi:GNAT superfamily N-acetyltransferase